jgi:hypothetical protein
MLRVAITLAWGLVVLLPFVSLGRVLARSLDPSLLDDPPLLAGIGMRGIVFIGGWLNLAGVASARGLVILIVASIQATRSSHSEQEQRIQNWATPAHSTWGFPGEVLVLLLHVTDPAESA